MPSEYNPKGTVVGNPGDAVARIGVAEDVVLTEATIDVVRVVATPCASSGDTLRLAVDQPLDVLGADALPIPAGDWCAISFAVGERGLRVLGRVAQEDAFEVWLDLEEISLLGDSAVRVDGGRYVLELGPEGWLSAELFDAAGGLQIEPGTPVHDALAEGVSYASGLFSDTDGDGELSDEERGSGAAVGGEDRDTDDRGTEDRDDEIVDDFDLAERCAQIDNEEECLMADCVWDDADEECYFPDD
jgi:hypothetical protein